MSLTNIEKMLNWVQENPPKNMEKYTAVTIFEAWLAATNAPEDLLFLYPAIDITCKTLTAITTSDYDVAFFNEKCPGTLPDWLRLFRHLEVTAQKWTTENSIQSTPPPSIRKDRHPLHGKIEKKSSVRLTDTIPRI